MHMTKPNKEKRPIPGLELFYQPRQTIDVIVNYIGLLLIFYRYLYYVLTQESFCVCAQPIRGDVTM